MNPEETANWWESASQEDREAFLYSIGAECITEHVWYVYPRIEHEANPDDD